MNTTLDSMSIQLNFDLNRSQSLNFTLANEDDLAEWCLALSFFARLLAYVAILALVVIVIFMILKYIVDSDNERTDEEATAAETNPLRPGKTMPLTYGSCERDLESGNCSSSSGNSSSSSSEELYDGKICVICYDEERNCFFVPCGHCATCYDCGQRIFNGEGRACPVCRRLIGKVRRLFAA